MSQIFIIIQARMTSERLPGKVILPLCDNTVLETMFKRLEQFHENIIIATTDDGNEGPIVELCKKNNIKFVRGSTEDVLSRYHKAADHYGAKCDDIIIRCTSDCPLIDPDILQEAVYALEASKNKDVIVTTGQPTGYPRGLDVEAFYFEQLQRAQKEAKTSFDREHVTPYIKQHCEWLKYPSFKDCSDYRLTLDVAEDYEVIKKVYALFDDEVDFDYRQLIHQLEMHPEITRINKDINQKTH